MKIIRVVHSEIDETLASSPTAFDLENYKFDAVSFVYSYKNGQKDWRKIAKSYAKVGLAVGAAGAVGAVAAALAGLGPTDEHVLSEKLEKVEFAANVAAAVVKEIRETKDRADVVSLENAKEKYPRTQNLSIGTYALHPYDSGRLTRLESYHTSLAMEKDDELISILGKMGARTVRIIESETGARSAEGSVNAAGTTFEAKTQLNIKKESTSETDLIVEFEGNQIDVDEDILNNSVWFSTDSKLNSILSSRRFNPNKIEQYTLTSTYQQTFDFDFDLAARYLMMNADIKAQYSSLCKKQRLFKVDFRAKADK